MIQDRQFKTEKIKLMADYGCYPPPKNAVRLLTALERAKARTLKLK